MSSNHRRLRLQFVHSFKVKWFAFHNGRNGSNMNVGAPKLIVVPFNCNSRIPNCLNNLCINTIPRKYDVILLLLLLIAGCTQRYIFQSNPKCKMHTHTQSHVAHYSTAMIYTIRCTIFETQHKMYRIVHFWPYATRSNTKSLAKTAQAQSVYHGEHWTECTV